MLALVILEEDQLLLDLGDLGDCPLQGEYLSLLISDFGGFIPEAGLQLVASDQDSLVALLQVFLLLLSSLPLPLQPIADLLQLRDLTLLLADQLVPEL